MPPFASVSSVVALGSRCLIVPRHALQGVPRAGRVPADVPSEVVTVLQQIKAADKDLLAVSEEDGRFLRVMVATSGAKRALEIGARQRLQRHLDRPRAAGDRRPADDDRIRPGARAAAPPTTSGAPASPTSSRSFRATRSRRSRSSPARSTSCSSTRGSATTSGSSIWSFRASSRAALFLAHNVVNKQSEMRDFLDAIQNDPGVAHLDRDARRARACRCR